MSLPLRKLHRDFVESFGNNSGKIVRLKRLGGHVEMLQVVRTPRLIRSSYVERWYSSLGCEHHVSFGSRRVATVMGEGVDLQEATARVDM